MIKYLILAVLSTSSVLAQYTGCDYLQNLNPSQAYDVFSPGFEQIPPQRYIPGTNCRWRAVAPPNYQITLNCFELRFPQNNCADRLEISLNGIYNDLNPIIKCAGDKFTYTTENQLVLALRTQATATGGGLFRCQVTALPKIDVRKSNVGRK